MTKFNIQDSNDPESAVEEIRLNFAPRYFFENEKKSGFDSRFFYSQSLWEDFSKLEKPVAPLSTSQLRWDGKKFYLVPQKIPLPEIITERSHDQGPRPRKRRRTEVEKLQLHGWPTCKSSSKPKNGEKWDLKLIGFTQTQVRIGIRIKNRVFIIIIFKRDFQVIWKADFVKHSTVGLVQKAKIISSRVIIFDFLSF